MKKFIFIHGGEYCMQIFLLLLVYNLEQIWTHIQKGQLYQI